MNVLGKDGRFELQIQLGQGPHSTVHRALDVRRRVPVIIKRLDAPVAAVTRYAEIVAKIKKANIPAAVTPFEVVTHDAPYAAFQSQDGDSLESSLRGGPLQWARAAEIVEGCAITLAAVAKATGETHRALKPSNVWLTAGGDALVLDFGASALGAPAPIRRGPEVVEYRAPEQLDGSPGDARTDVFALAVLLVEVTTGIHPFVGATTFQAAHKLTRTPPDLAELTRGMTPASAREVGKFMVRALAADPAARPADAATFASELAYVRTLVGAPAPARPPRPEVAPAPIPPRKPIDDLTTIQQLPGMRALFTPPPADPAKPVTAAPANPVTAAPANPDPSPPPAPRAPPTPPVPLALLDPLPSPALSHRPVPEDRTIKDLEPRRAAPRTEAASRRAPVLTDRPLRARPSAEPPTEVLQRPARAHVPTDRTLRDPPPKDVATQALPQRPAHAPVPTDRTLRDLPPEDVATQALPQLPPRRPLRPADDELATIHLPRTTRAPADPDITFQLPGQPGEAAPAVFPPADNEPAGPAPPTMQPAAQQPAASMTKTLIRINIVCLVLAIIGLAIAALT